MKKLFVWDGSDVTELISKADIFEAEYNKKKYWKIKILQNNSFYVETVIVRTSKGNIPSLIDEIKPVFGLPKLGTHWCKVGSKYYILIKCLLNIQGYVQEEYSLKTYLELLNNSNNNKNKSVEELLDALTIMQIRGIFAFREILGITKNFESSIVMRKRGNSYYPISFYEPNMKDIGVKVMPSSILEKWFENTTLDEEVKKLVKIYNLEELAAKVQDIRSKLEKIITRLDPDNIRFSDYICTKIIDRVQAC